VINFVRSSFVAVAVVLVALGLARSTDAQPAGKVWSIGQLDVSGDPIRLDWWKGFRQHLAELGYVEGRNLRVESRFRQSSQDQMAALAADLVRLQVDVIVVASTEGALAAKQATTAIPIVAVTPGDPVGTRLVASLARPGGNVTGLSLLATDLAGKQLELLKEIVPGVSRIAILSNPNNASHAARLKEALAAAQALKVHLDVQTARSSDDLDRAFETMAGTRASAVLMLADPLFIRESTRLAQLAAKTHLPVMYGLREHVNAGGLVSYGVSFPHLFHRAAGYVDKILKGAKPADLPVEQPTTFELVINLKTAKALGLTVPQSMLMRANEVSIACARPTRPTPAGSTRLRRASSPLL
jgi:putative ABC transport system substrate-binding protein